MKLELLTLASTAALLLAMGGCATKPPVDAATLAAANEPLYCDEEAQCKRFWQRAQVWVASNSRWKIQTVTDSLIVTYTPTRAAVELGYQITKTPLSGGREQIQIASGCDNIFRCEPHQDVAAASFKSFVKGN